MKLKPIVAITVLSLVVASLLVAGCTTSTTSNTNQTSSATSSTATHDALLEKLLAEYKNQEDKNSSLSMKAWEVEWINSTSARLQETAVVKPSNTTISYDITYMVFPTSQDATQYLNAMNKTAYSLATTLYRDSPTALAYQNATGHAPQIFKKYQWNERNSLNISEFKLHEILQADNIVVVDTAKILS
jgi:outer membrane murein-binding lipoprotein Lpp